MANMERYLSPIIFGADFGGEETLTGSYKLVTALEAGFKEDWLQRAIEKNVDLVAGPCRAGRLIPRDEEWRFWGSEVSLKEAGGISIDALLLSASGRIGIVETKLAYNPGARREVVAQVLEYAIHFRGVSIEELTAHLPVPLRTDGHAFVEPDVIQRKVEDGDYLLIVAGDQLDPRAVRLSSELLGTHIIHGWDLAMVEVSVFERKTDIDKKEYILVPHLGSAIKVDQRQVVKVIIEEKRMRVEVEQKSEAVTVNRPKWDEERFFAGAKQASAPVARFADELRRLQQVHPGVSFDFGTSKDGSLILKKEGSNILEFYLGYGGYIRFRPKNEAGQDNFSNALGDVWGGYYREELQKLFRRSMKMGYPLANFATDHAERVLPLLEEVIARTGSKRHQSMVAS